MGFISNWTEKFLFICLLLTSIMAGGRTRTGVVSLECFECSDFPREDYSEDEDQGTCPGWLRPPRKYPNNSLYDGCMSILLANGTVVSQNAVVYDQCASYQQSQRAALRNVFGMSVRIRCCRGQRCNAPKKLQKKLLRYVGQLPDDNTTSSTEKARQFLSKFYSEHGDESTIIMDDADDGGTDNKVRKQVMLVPAEQRSDSSVTTIQSGQKKSSKSLSMCQCNSSGSSQQSSRMTAIIAFLLSFNL